MKEILEGIDFTALNNAPVWKRIQFFDELFLMPVDSDTPKSADSKTFLSIQSSKFTKDPKKSLNNQISSKQNFFLINFF